jgi:predicted TIM-barrel fold metal-dependent hydrolase
MMRRSPWGPLRVADAHVHFFSHRFFSGLVAQKPGLTLEAARETLGWELPPPEPEALAARWVDELDRHNVAAAAIIASIAGDEASVLAAAQLAPNRLLPCAMVNPRGPWSVEALAGIRMACLFPAMHLYSVQDDCVRPVFEWAERERRAVFVHCGVLSVGVRKKLGLASPFDLRYSNPVDLHAVALRFPSVPIVVPHFGAGYLREALMLADLCPNVYLDTSSSNDWMKYHAPPLELAAVFRQALAVAGPQRLLFGTDSSFFPRGWQAGVFDAQTAVLYELGLDAAGARAVFADNLLRILAP